MTEIHPTTYRPLPIPRDDFLALRGAAQDRDRNLRLELVHIDDTGEDYITVMPAQGKSDEDPLWTIRRAETENGTPCWIVRHPEDSSGCEFKAIVDVANYVAF